MVIGAIALLAAGILAYVFLDGIADDVGVIGPEDEAAPTAETITATSVDTDETAPEAAPAEPPPVEPIPPYVEATFDGKNLVVAGTVADDGLVQQLDSTTQLIYAPFATSDVQVDPQLDSPEWLAAAPNAVALLQTVSSSSLVVSEGRIRVSGQAASAEDAAQFEAYLRATGLPVEITDMEITNLRDAVYVIAATDGTIALSGALPSEEIRTALAETAAAVYGTENVFDASTVDETVATALWMYTPEALIATLSAFPSFEVRLDGREFSASLGGGAVFDSGSVAITPEFAQILNFGVVVLAREPAMTITIEGHTDSQGADEYNLALSQERADAVAAYFSQAGIDASRITAVGRGEQSPIASNDTPEGRAINRRVDFSLQTNN